MPEYTTQATASEPDDANNVFLEIEVLRDGKGVATFKGKFPKAIADSVIVAQIEKRVQGFVDADSDRIEKELLQQRADAIAAAFDDRLWP